MLKPTASLIECFASIQGEGARIGEPHVFVRFHGCSLSCRYCDTPETHAPLAPCRIFPSEEQATTDASTQAVPAFIEPNPITGERLTEIIDSQFSGYRTISLTGGEPLEQAAFLASWLPEFKKNRDVHIMLETAGVHDAALERVLPFIDTISMDLKPRSATGMSRDFFEHHRRCLTRATQSSCHVYVKVVIDSTLTVEEETDILTLIASFPSLTYFIQPLSPISPKRLARAMALTHRLHKRGYPVRLVPQIHPLLGLK